MNDITQPLVAHSVLNADRLAVELAQRYRLRGEVKAQLLYRGMNDVYLAHDDVVAYALRAWRGGWRTLDEVDGELAFLNFLRERDFPAAFPVQAADGTWRFTLDAPEGRRALALYEWAPGVKFADALDVDTARRIGADFARLHLIGADFVRPSPHSLKGRAAAPQNVAPLLELVYDRPEDRRDYALLAEALRAEFTRIAEIGLPSGPCHGDFHPGNVHVTPEGMITFLDFDGCGDDYYLQDVANYVFGNEFYGFDRAYADAFRAGYESVRPFTEAERSLFDFFMLSKTFRLVSGLAANVNAVGRGSLRYRGLDWFSETLRRDARKLGLL